MSRRARSFVAQIVPRGRGVAARPAFEDGPPITLSRTARGKGRIGDLVVIAMRGRGGMVSQVLGRADDPRVAIDALLTDSGRRRGFGRAAREEAEAAAEANVAGDPSRRDLRGQLVVTIDPEGAKDHDDAIAVESIDGGTRLFVHIADVARFVPVGGAIDLEAARRGFSTYAPGTVEPMLPSTLSAGACSVHAGADRAVVTAEIDFDPDARVTGTRFYRSLVHSRRDLTYDEVDAHLGGATFDDSDLEAAIDRARTLAAAIRKRRLSRGALALETGEVRFRFDDDGIAGVERETQTESHQIIEEFMVAANEAVARHLLDRGQPGIFRVHEDPEQAGIERLYDQLEALGVSTPPLGDGSMTAAQRRQAATAAAAILSSGGHGGAGQVALQVLVLRALKQARYSVENLGHSGLASDAYLHFTSPIRRYPDLLVHRALLATLGEPEVAPTPQELSEAAVSCSETEREISRLERRTTRLCAALLLEARRRDGAVPQKVEGEVVGVIGGGAFVAFDVAFEGFLPSRTLGDDYFSVDALEVSLVGERSGARLALGDTVEVTVAGTTPLRGRVDLEPVDRVARRRSRRRR